MLAAEVGAKIVEVPVRHHARTRGVSKYGIDRTFRVLLDLLWIKFLMRFLHRPLQAFGGVGLTVAGALTPAGLGGCVIELMERGLVDFIISTGANLYHDLHYALNFTLRRGSPFVDDRVLYREGVIRIYDVLFPAQVLLDTLDDLWRNRDGGASVTAAEEQSVRSRL